MSRISGLGMAMVSAVLLISCASINPPVDPARLAAIENGKTTRAEVEATLGKPTLVSTLIDGKVYVAYMVRIKPTQADDEPQTRYISMRYDSAGVVRDLDKSETKSLVSVTAGSGPAPSPEETRAGGIAKSEELKPKRKPFIWPENNTPNR